MMTQLHTRSNVIGSSKLRRRELLRLGLTGFAGLSWSDILRLQAVAATAKPFTDERPAVILVWLRGGASHLETFDLKPMAPTEIRGPYQPIATNVPGVEICELLPQLAKIADKYTLLRSIAHRAGEHPNGARQILGGDSDNQDRLLPTLPDWMSIANYFLRDTVKALPHYVGVNPIDNYDAHTIAGATYLGPSYEAFKVFGDPNAPQFRVPNIGLPDDRELSSLTHRVTLRQSLDGLLRTVDQNSNTVAVDRFYEQAINMLVSPIARSAFDLSLEPDAVRDRYGRHQWGQQCLMARRLVEAGVDIVATEFDGPLCGRVANWDDHSVNQHIFEAMQFRLPTLDQAVSALIEDIYARGLDRRVLVIVAGEFGRTPQISYVGSSGEVVASRPAGTIQPGRDHWARANSMLFAGGGMATGQIIGATNKLGQHPIARRVGPQDFLATIYQHLGIDYQNATIPNLIGQPVKIVVDGEAIPELARLS